MEDEMTTETILTVKEISKTLVDAGILSTTQNVTAYDIVIARAIEKAVLQSKQVQAWKRDAERYRKLSAMATQQADSLGPIFRIDVRRSAPYLFDFDAAIDAAMEKQK